MPHCSTPPRPYETASRRRRAAPCTPPCTAPRNSTQSVRSPLQNPKSAHYWSTSLRDAGNRPAFAYRVFQNAPRCRLPVAIPLSSRERKVLDQLPSLHTIEEIADHLAVSVNTIKTHVRAIYRKLGVSSRRTAVLAAHEQGLLR